MLLFSDRGIPDGFRHMHGFGSSSFKLIDSTNSLTYCKFHYKTDQGIKNLTPEKAKQLSSSDPDYMIRDLYNAIASGNYPSWTLYIQVMTPKQAKTFRWNPFDVTKVWPHKEFPLIRVGKFVLNKNPENYFADVEQIAFSPANLVPGIEPSPDKLFQGWLFAYQDAQRYRLGNNYQQLPVNCPYRVSRNMNYQRDGLMAIRNQGGAPNYFPNSFGGPREHPAAKAPSFEVGPEADRYQPMNEDDFGQATSFWREVLDSDARGRLVKNIVDNLKNASNSIIVRVLKNFAKVDYDMVKMINEELRKVGKQINDSPKFASI